MKKLFLCVFSSIVFIFLSAFPALALSDSSSNSVTVTGFTYNSGEDYCTSFTPVGGSVPSGYNLVAVTVQPHNFSNGSTRVCYFYAPSSFESITMYVNGSDQLVISSSPNSSPFYYVMNRFDNNYNQTYVSPYSGSITSRTTTNSNFIAYSYLPILDNNGNIFTPEILPQFDLNCISSSDTLHYNVTPKSSDIASFDFYLFPSSFPETGGAVTNIISSPTYITEISASAQYEIENDGFASFVDGLQDTYNAVTSGGLLPSIHYFAECTTTYFNRSFDASSYNLPFVKLGTYNVGTHFGFQSGGQYLDLQSIANSSSGVYAYDNLCIVAVGHKDNRDFLARLDFSVSALRNTSVVPPNDIIDSNIYQGGTITDLQELANYIKYLFENSDHNLSVEFHNFTAYLQHIPWKSMIEEGVYFGFSDVIPKLQDFVFDTDYDLPALVNELSPLLEAGQLSLPDLTGALTPFFNSLDLSPTGNFAGMLNNMNNDFNGHLDTLFTDLSGSVTDLSTEINNNTTEIFVPDLDDMNDRLEISQTLLSNKFSFVDDVKDNLEDVRDTIANSSDSPPDWHFTVFGVRLFLVDWSVYEPYRSTVKNIFVCIAYILLFKHIYKTIPLNGGDDS